MFNRMIHAGLSDTIQLDGTSIVTTASALTITSYTILKNGNIMVRVPI